MIVLYDCSINVILKFDGDEILGIAFFKISHIWYAMEEGEVIDNGIKVQMVLVGIARHLYFPYLKTRIAAEYDDRLGFIWPHLQVLTDSVKFNR